MGKNLIEIIKNILMIISPGSVCSWDQDEADKMSWERPSPQVSEWVASY